VFHSVKEDFVYLAHLAVLPEYRGLSIAKALVEAVEKETVQQGLSKVRLSVRLGLCWRSPRGLEKAGFRINNGEC
jgi:ribosomal protein S18 acetylase RimI-like enzyme